MLAGAGQFLRESNLPVCGAWPRLSSQATGSHPAREGLPLTMDILQPDIPVRRMMSERRTKLTDALVRVLCRLLTPGCSYRVT